MVIVNDLKPGMHIEQDGELYNVINVDHNKTAMRQMIIKVKVRNLRSGVIKELNFTGGDKVETARIAVCNDVFPVISVQVASPDHVVDALPADPLLSGDLAQRKVFADRCFINILLVIGQQLTVKIKEQRSTQNIVHAAHYIGAFYVCQVFFLDSLNDDHCISEREKTISFFHRFPIRV